MTSKIKAFKVDFSVVLSILIGYAIGFVGIHIWSILIGVTVAVVLSNKDSIREMLNPPPDLPDNITIVTTFDVVGTSLFAHIEVDSDHLLTVIAADLWSKDGIGEIAVFSDHVLVELSTGDNPLAGKGVERLHKILSGLPSIGSRIHILYRNPLARPMPYEDFMQT